MYQPVDHTSWVHRQARAPGAKIRIGPAGWDYQDWRGVVYPNKKKTKSFDELAYLARYFDTVEINNTFYRPGDPKAAAAWAKRVEHNPDFKFTAKLWRRFTHERDQAWTAGDVKAARAAFDVLQEADRLGAVLLQFPWSFKRDDSTEEWLRDVFAAFAGLPLVLEVRHASWNSGDVLAQLTDRGVGLVNVDQPLFKRSMKPAAHATSAVGYVRLHGRNWHDWFRKGTFQKGRYDYLYTPEELRPWVDRIEDIAARPTTKELYAVTNNHNDGKAPANAAMIDAMLEGEKVPVPPTLFARYHEQLEPFAVPDPEAADLGIAGGEASP
jgi:uncharacterized protein YecE (DUF72 family)